MSDDCKLDMMDQMDFDRKLEEMGDNPVALIKFLARQQFATGKVLVAHAGRIKAVERKNNKVMAIIGGAGAIIGSVVIALIDYFTKNPS